MFDPSKLRWAPPAQSSPTIHNVAIGNSVVRFGPTEDVVLVMPAAPKTSQSQFLGGRHIRVIGGAVAIGSTGGSLSLAFQYQTGSVFVEGISFDNTSRPLRDCLWFGGGVDPETSAATAPDVYVQNCTMRGITGFPEGIHGDAIQTGDYDIGDVRIDCVDVQTGYQGLFLSPGPSGFARPLVDLSRCTLSNVEEEGQWPLYLYDNDGLPHVGDIRLRDVWIDSWVDESWPYVPAVMPHQTHGAVAKVVQGPIPGSWRFDPARGYLLESDRSAFTIGTPGLSYSSPGYNTDPHMPFVPVSVDGGGLKPRLLHHFMSAQPDGVYRFPASTGTGMSSVAMTWSGGSCSYSGTITVPVEQPDGGITPQSLTFVNGILQGD